MNTQPPDDPDKNLDFDALCAKYEQKIFNIIYRFIGDYEEAGDLTQETFIRAHRDFDNSRGDLKVFTWLYQIARSLCINRIRQRDRQRSLEIESLDQPPDADDEESHSWKLIAYAQAPHQKLEESELRQRLLAAIEALPPSSKEGILSGKKTGA